MVFVRRLCNGLWSSVMYWFLFIDGVMVCVPRWCNGFCSSVV